VESGTSRFEGELLSPTAPTATANRGFLSLGDQGFAGGGGTAFTGSAAGTAIAINTGTADYFHAQSGGVSKAQITNNGRLVLAEICQSALAAWSWLSKTANFTLGGTAALHSCDATGGAFNMILPDAAGRTGRVYTIKKVDSSTNAVTVTTTSSQTIDLTTTYILQSQWQSITVYSTGTNWEILSTGKVRAFVAKSADYTIASGDCTVFEDATAAIRTVTLPTAVGRRGAEFNVKKTDSSGNKVTVATTSSQTIDGVTTKDLTVQYQSITVVSDGANWGVIS
jgi:hypothetical protein